MGYELYITRQDHWFDENESRQISLDEWLQVLTNDEELRLDNFAEATTANGDTIRTGNQGLSVWTKYSGNGINGNYAWLSYSRGNIDCKNPDEEIIHKMLDIADRLKAKVQGEQGEIYKRSADNKISGPPILAHSNYRTLSKKRWWKLW